MVDESKLKVDIETAARQNQISSYLFLYVDKDNAAIKPVGNISIMDLAPLLAKVALEKLTK